MNSLNLLIRRSFSTVASTSTPSKQTALYLWTSMPKLGPKASELKQQMQIPKGTPNRVESFDNLNIQRILIGLRHSAALSNDGKLYLFGSGNWGVLGQGNEKDARFDSPQLVDFFEKRGKKVMDVALGEYHSVALTDDGSVYTWGYAGKTGMFNWMYTQECGALGHGDKKHHFSPKKVEYFEKHGIKIKQVFAGLYHTVALSTTGQVYTWGRGLYGVLGNGSNQYALEPELNEELDLLQKDEGKEIAKIDTADEYTGVLMKDGSLYVWGKNDKGQMGVGSGIGIDMVESENIPTQISVGTKEDGTPKIITDFHAGMNTMLIKDEQGLIYKTGLKLDFSPKEISMLPEFVEPDVIEGMTCGRKHYVLWNKHNQLLVWGSVFKEKPQQEKDGFGLYFGDSIFDGGHIKQLSMKYGIFGALVDKVSQ